jgi:uncharacterized membrane protein YtjA (UPF0391 family)
MKKLIILFIIIFIFSLAIMAAECTINIPDKVGITIETGQTAGAETTQAQTTITQPPTTEKRGGGIGSIAEIVFLIITIVSFVIALVSAIFGFRKEEENTAGKILFTIFIILFLVFLILYILSLINIL